MTTHRSTLGRIVTVVVIVGVLAAGAFRLLQIRSSEPAAADPPGRDVGAATDERRLPPALPLDCETEGYPCSWDDVNPEVFNRTWDLAHEALDHFARGGAKAAAAWLRAQPEPVEVRGGGNVAGFRLEGGRYAWLGPSLPGMAERMADTYTPDPAPQAHAARPRERIPLTSSWRDALAGLIAPTVHAQIAGRDRNGDARLDQRDYRAALQVEKLDPSGLDDQFLTSAAYAGHIEKREHALTFTGGENGVQPDPSNAGWRDYLGWHSFDVIHLAAASVSNCDLPTGLEDFTGVQGCHLLGFLTDDVFEGGRRDIYMRDSFRRLLGAEGRPIDFYIVGTPDDSEAWAFVTPDFLQDAYAQHDMSERFVFLSANYSADDSSNLYRRIFRIEPSYQDPRGDMVHGTLVGWRGFITREEKAAAARDVYRTLDSGRAADEAPIVGTDSRLAVIGADVRVRELVTLLDEHRRPLEDGGTIRARTSRDGSGLVTSFFVRIDPLDLARRGTGVSRTFASVFINRERVAFSDDLAGQPTQDGATLVRFANVRLPDGISRGESYDVVAGGGFFRRGSDIQSMYSVRLTVDTPRGCEWQADVSGPAFNGRIEGAGIRLASTDRFSALQLDGGTLQGFTESSSQLSGLTFPLGVPPGEGGFSASDSMVGLWKGLGTAVSATQTGSVSVTTFEPSADGNSVWVIGTFEAVFGAVFTGSRIVRGDTVVSGWFSGELTGERGCGSQTFRWFDRIARSAGSGSEE